MTAAEDLAFDAILSVVHLLMTDFELSVDAALGIVRGEFAVVEKAIEDERRVPLTADQIARARVFVTQLKARAQSR